MNLTDKVALVTGASGGIGRSVSIALAKAGADVVINYSGNLAKAEEVQKEVEALGRKAMVIKADISSADEVSAMMKAAVKSFGKIDILVNNAGITRDGSLLMMKEEDWDAVLNTNLKGVFLCTKTAAKLMLKKKYGRIINIASVVGLIGNAGQANYSAAKAGVIGLTKTSARELAARNITVNAVAPGFIQTKMTDVLPEEVKESMLSQVPLARLGTPDEVADAVLFLASDRASYITGQVISVNGGMVM
ncbi:MAG: 3-oxoacyl-[acyl-carrier-protein] reductase [bacterium]